MMVLDSAYFFGPPCSPTLFNLIVCCA